MAEQCDATMVSQYQWQASSVCGHSVAGAGDDGSSSRILVRRTFIEVVDDARRVGRQRSFSDPCSKLQTLAHAQAKLLPQVQEHDGLHSSADLGDAEDAASDATADAAPLCDLDPCDDRSSDVETEDEKEQQALPCYAHIGAQHRVQSSEAHIPQLKDKYSRMEHEDPELKTEYKGAHLRDESSEESSAAQIFRLQDERARLERENYELRQRFGVGSSVPNAMMAAPWGQTGPSALVAAPCIAVPGLAVNDFLRAAGVWLPASAGNATQAENMERPQETVDPKAPKERTTVMVRNIPNNYSREMIVSMFDAEGFMGYYDFIYMPIDFRSRAALGYAFVNLKNSATVEKFWEVFGSYKRWVIPTKKVGYVTWCGPHQGLEAHVERYRNSPVMHDAIPDAYKPVIFIDGKRAQFPPPTRSIRAPRLRDFSRAQAPGLV